MGGQGQGTSAAVNLGEYDVLADAAADLRQDGTVKAGNRAVRGDIIQGRCRKPGLCLAKSTPGKVRP